MLALTALVIGAAIGLEAPPDAQAAQPVVAGENGVSVPKKTKNILPVYPPEAQARGQRGIVIVELTIDTQGKVSSAQVIRSIPPFDEAALTAVRQWEYEVTRVGGRPVSVKLTVPITFAIKVPEIASRQEGIPELRAGALPPVPPEARAGQSATAEVTLGADGTVEELRILDGPPALADILARALRTWRFEPDSGEAVVTFRVRAQVVSAARGASAMEIRLDGLRRSESLEPQTAQATPEAAPAPATTAPTTAEPPPPEPAAAAATPSATPATPPAAPPATSPRLAATQPQETAPAAPPPASAEAPAVATPRPPAMEVLNVPPPPLPPENGLSAIQGVTLAPGVPDLTKGRRPVPPPFARMAQATGTVEVKFSVDAAGIATVKGSSGPDVFKRAAEQAVASWTFRRTRADRIFLVADFTYGLDTASASVRPELP
jgi:TonB family protein